MIQSKSRYRGFNEKMELDIQVKSLYRAQRKRHIFSESDEKPYKLSRSRIENFIRCQRCFFLDRKCGTEQPPMFPYTLNNTVDALLKREFDQYRSENKSHPYLIEHGIDAIPFSHSELDNWRMNQRGIKYYHEATNFIVTGAVDDIWINSKGELIIVDYKATSTKKDVALDDRDSYKRQMEIYQWLFRKNGFDVSNTGYFVYCNGDSVRTEFSGMLQFKVSLLSYVGDGSWVENILYDIKSCLINNVLPDLSQTCDYCKYWDAVTKHVESYRRERKRSLWTS